LLGWRGGSREAPSFSWRQFDERAFKLAKTRTVGPDGVQIQIYQRAD